MAENLALDNKIKRVRKAAWRQGWTGAQPIGAPGAFTFSERRPQLEYRGAPGSLKASFNTSSDLSYSTATPWLWHRD